MVQSVGIIGYGQFGAFLESLANRFAPHLEVRICSARFTPGEGRFVTLEEAAAADVVIIASAIRRFEKTLDAVAPLLGSHSVLVDVATVKAHPAGMLRARAAGDPPFRFIATHPMFGPYSFAKEEGSLAGLRIVLTDHNLDAETYGRAKAALQAVGLVVLEMTPDAHDRALAETLFLAHYIGQIVTHGGFLRTDIDTLSFGFLMDAVESVRNDTQLFQDVFQFNPYCGEVVRRFEAAEGGVARLLGIAPDERN